MMPQRLSGSERGAPSAVDSARGSRLTGDRSRGEMRLETHGAVYRTGRPDRPGAPGAPDLRRRGSRPRNSSTSSPVSASACCPASSTGRVRRPERADLAHTLKGSALGIGARWVADLSGAVEDGLRGGSFEPDTEQTLARAVAATIGVLFLGILTPTAGRGVAGWNGAGSAA